MFLAPGATEPLSLSPFMSVHHTLSRILSLVCPLARSLDAKDEHALGVCRTRVLE